MAEILVNRLQHLNDRGAQRYYEDCREYEQHKGEKHLNGCLRRLLFDLLDTLSPQRFRMDTQRLSNTCSKLLRLNKHRYNIAHAIDVGPIREVSPRVCSRATSPLL